MSVKSIGLDAVDTYSPEDSQAVLDEMKIRLDDCWSDWDRIYRKSLECCEMISGKIFKPEVKAQRLAENRPVIEVNQLVQYTERVLGFMRQSPACIKFRSTTPDVAGKAIGIKTNSSYEQTEVLSSLIKDIERSSNANMWYDRACMQMVHGGVGWLRIYPAYKDDKSFDMTLRISGVTNFTNAILDMSGLEQDFSDARYGFVFENIPRKEFEARWPDVSCASVTNREYAGRLWTSTDMVTIAEYFERVSVEVKIHRLIDGTVVEVGDKSVEVDKAQIVETRKCRKYKVLWRKVCETDILEGGVNGIELPFSEIPLIPMIGRESFDEAGRNFESLIVHAMDAQREASYWRTMMTEQVALQPKAKWLASSAQVENRRDDWERANTLPMDVLTYDIDPSNPAAMPTRVQPTQIAAAEMQQYLSSIQDMKACIGMYDAAIGNVSGEVSGRAILARERQSDTGTYVFVHHRNDAIKRLGRLALEGIKKIYTDTATIRIFLPDETTDFVTINNPKVDIDTETNAKKTIIENDVTVGDYDVYVDSGPAYSTLRIEAVNSLMEMAQTNPELLTIAGDIMALNMDWPGARQFAERLRRWINLKAPGVLSPTEFLEIQEQQQSMPPPPPPPPDPVLELQNAIQQGKVKQAEFNAEKERARAITAQAEAETERTQAAVAATVSGDERRIRAIVEAVVNDYLSAGQ